MSRRLVINGFLFVLSLMLVCWVIGQRRELTALANQRQQLSEAGSVALDVTETSAQSTPAVSTGPSPELLRLRSQVNQLNTRVRELSQVQTENARLLAEVAKRGTNTYIRKTQARMAGYNTPAATMETFLWSLQNRDLPALLQCFAPEAAQIVKNAADKERSGNDFFHSTEGFIGLGITSQEQLPDGTWQLEAQIAPQIPSVHLNLRQLNGEWKLISPP